MLLASRRLTDDPRASFGAIAGVIMAVFVASAFFSFVAYADGQEFDRAGVIAADQVYVEMPYNEGPPFAEVPARIAAVPGVRSVLPIATAELMEIGPATAWVVPCVDLARQFGLPVGECGDGSVKVHSVGGDTPLEPGSYTIIPDRGERRPITLTVAAGDTAPLLTPDFLGNRMPQLIIEPDALTGPRAPSPTKFYVTTDGSAATGERLRTTVLESVPTAYVRLAAESRSTSRVFEEFGRVVGLGLIGTLVLAGCSLAVAVTTSVLERRRQFALLRSAGHARVPAAGAGPAASGRAAPGRRRVLGRARHRRRAADPPPGDGGRSPVARPVACADPRREPGRRPRGRRADAAAARAPDPAGDRPGGVAPDTASAHKRLVS